MDKKNIGKYIEKLRNQLAELEKENNELEKKFFDGKELTSKENKRHRELVQLISRIKEDLRTLESANSPSKINEALEILSSDTISQTEKDAIIKSILVQFEEINAKGSSNIGLTEDELRDLSKTHQDLSDELNNLNTTLNTLKRINADTTVVENAIKEIEAKLEKIVNYQNTNINIAEIESELTKLSDNQTEEAEKIAIMAKLNALYASSTPSNSKELEELIAKYEKEFGEDNDKDKKKSVLEFLKEKTEELSETTKKGLKITGAVILCTAIIVAGVKLYNHINKSNENDDTLDRPGYEQSNDNTTSNGNTDSTNEPTEEDKNTKTIEALTEKGYNEYISTIMANHFSDNTIGEILEAPYNETITKYATVKDFDLDYLNDYEEIKEIYNITAEKTVDYVNRSYKISETGFYAEASIDDIVNVVMSIDNKDLFRTNNATLAQSFNTSFNRIVDNFLFGKVTEEDIKKLDALQYLASDGTDMDKFLTEFATLCQNILKDPDNKEAKDEMYTYLTTFTLSVNGYTNVDEDYPVAKPYNENAMLNDYFDWYIAYTSFVAPLYPIYCPIFEDYTDLTQYETDMRRWTSLQSVMETALQDPQIQAFCDEDPSLGGN